MTGDPREACEQYLLAKLDALTVADGLPQTFRLVTRELTHLADVSSGSLPACFLQMEEPEVIPKLSHVVEVTLPGRIVVAFAASQVLPATDANAYRMTLEKMIAGDVHLGGLVDAIWLNGTLMPGLWEHTGLLGLGVLFRCVYEYDPRMAAITS